MRLLGRTSRGSVLMLMPAAVLIVLLLGAIAVDSAIVYLGQRQAYNVAFDAANDAAGAGFDADIARTTGEFVYDPDRIEALALAAVEAAGVHELRLVETNAEPGGVVAVTVEITIDHLFVQVFGRGGSEPLAVTARATGEVRSP